MYIFAYGSLVNQFSRSFTYRVEDAIPVIVDGFVRSWSKISYSKAGISPLVVHKGEGRCNGVLIPVSEEHLHFFDLRGKNYKRVRVSSSQILTLNKFPLPLEKTIWIYIVPDHVTPGSTRLSEPVRAREHARRKRSFSFKISQEIFINLL